MVGADHVGRFLLGATTTRPSVEMLEQQTNDGLGFALWTEGRIAGIATLEVHEGRITAVRLVLNPDKLTLWS